MGIGQDPRSRKATKSGWVTERLKGGGTLSGWLAGKVEWVDCHYDGTERRSVPCFKLLKGCPLPCDRCRTFPRVTLLGYVPWYGEGGRKCLSIVGEDSIDIVMSLKVFEPITVKRGKEWHDPIVISRHLKGERYTPYSDVRKDGADLTQALLTMWKEPELKSWWESRPDRTDREVMEAAIETQRKADKEAAEFRNRLGNLLKVAKAREGGDVPTVGDSLPELPKPSANGVHKPR